MAETPKEVKKYRRRYSSRFYRWLVRVAWPFFERNWNLHKIPGRRIYLIGQSHIDAAWVWRWRETVEKVRVTFEKAIRHIREYPGFKFSASSPAYYAWMEEYYPEVFESIREAVKAGRWELVGGCWIEPDGNMPDGESLCRQRLYGQRYYLEKFGRISEVGWMLDSFGFSWSWPQVLSKSGARFFWTSKIKWNRQNAFPFNYFWWEGPGSRPGWQVETPGDPGSKGASESNGHSETNMEYRGWRVLAVSCPGGWGPPMEMRSTDLFQRLPKPGIGLVASYETSMAEIEEKLSGDYRLMFGIFYGKGDGGHGPLEREVVEAEVLAQKFPRYRLSRAVDFFEDILSGESGRRLPTWRSELYLEYHRGVLTTKAGIKSANRRNEVRLKEAEVLATLAWVSGLTASPGSREFREVWKKLLFNQFHDVLPGTSIPEVYEDAFSDHAATREFCERVTGEILSAVAARVRRAAGGSHSREPRPGGEKQVLLVNLLSWARSARVELGFGELSPGEFNHGSGLVVLDERGRPVPHQVVQTEGHRVVAFHVPIIPAMGYVSWSIVPGMQGEVEKVVGGVTARREDAPASRDGVPTPARGLLVLENERIRVEVDAFTGDVIQLRHLGAGWNSLGPAGARLRLFKDTNDPWNLNPSYLDEEIPLPPAKSVRVAASGPVVAVVEVEREVGSSPVTVQYLLWAGCPILEVRLEVDWRERGRLLKLACEGNLDAKSVRADVAYGVIAHLARPEQPWDIARFEKCCHKWVDIGEEACFPPGRSVEETVGRYPWAEKNRSGGDSGTRGLAILSHDKYGFSHFANSISLSLLRGTRYPDTKEGAVDCLPTGHPDRPIDMDRGIHHIRVALFPHDRSWWHDVWRLGEQFNAPPLVYLRDLGVGGISGGGGNSRKPDYPGVSTGVGNGDSAPGRFKGGVLPPAGTLGFLTTPRNVVVGAVKRAEDDDGVVLRVVEALGRPVKRATILLGGLLEDLEILGAVETDILEFPLPASKTSPRVEGSKIHFPLGAFEIKTIKIELARPGFPYTKDK
ncbi:MAG: alpha-mannosidase [Promethearchaeota archaeon]